jgi:hypothetical protein
MPNCFSLTKKGSVEPMSPAQVDDFICQQVGVEPNAHRYYMGWYDVIGMLLALGAELGSDKLRAKVKYIYNEDAQQEIEAVLDVLEQNFTSDAYCTRT